MIFQFFCFYDNIDYDVDFDNAGSVEKDHDIDYDDWNDDRCKR